MFFICSIHLPRPIFYSPSSKCTRIGERASVSFPHCILNQALVVIYWKDGNPMISFECVMFSLAGSIRNLSPQLWTMHHLTALFLNDNNLTRLPPAISQLSNLVYLDLSCNKIRSLPAELGDLIHMRELLLGHNHIRVLPFELGRLFQLQTLGEHGELQWQLMSTAHWPIHVLVKLKVLGNWSDAASLTPRLISEFELWFKFLQFLLQHLTINQPFSKPQTKEVIVFPVTDPPPLCNSCVWVLRDGALPPVVWLQKTW